MVICAMSSGQCSCSVTGMMPWGRKSLGLCLEGFFSFTDHIFQVTETSSGCLWGHLLGMRGRGSDRCYRLMCRPCGLLLHESGRLSRSAPAVGMVVVECQGLCHGICTRLPLTQYSSPRHSWELLAWDSIDCAGTMSCMQLLGAYAIVLLQK